MPGRRSLDRAWHGPFDFGRLEGRTKSLRKVHCARPATRRRFGGAIANYHLNRRGARRFEDVPRDQYPLVLRGIHASSFIALGELTGSGGHESALAGGDANQGGVIHAARALLRTKRGDRKGAIEDVNAAIALGSGFGHFHHTATWTLTGRCLSSGEPTITH